MKVLIVSATEKEVLQIKQSINPLYTKNTSALQVLFFTTGAGILSSCFYIQKLIYEQKPNIIIQAGIAGTFDRNFNLGTVAAIKNEVIADMGVEENGDYKDLFDLNLLNKNAFPFSDTKLGNPQLERLNLLNLDEVAGITVNEITTRPQRIEQYKAKYRAQTESMEGASLHYCGLQTSTPFIQIRAISNYIGERDKSKWNFASSLNNLTHTVLLYIDELNNLNGYQKR